MAICVVFILLRKAVRASGRYRYVDWLLTVPLLLIELVLVMGLPAEETSKMTWRLGAASALMVARLF